MLNAVIRDYSANSYTFTECVAFGSNTRVGFPVIDDLNRRAAVSYERLDSND